MKQYNYVVSTEKGVKKKGLITASNEDAAIQKLKKEFPIIISITEKTRHRQFFWERPHLSFEDKLMFTKHMATMLRVGITISEAVEIIISQSERKNNRKMYENMLERINAGQSLSESLREYKDIFSEVFVNMIATGEKSGTLEQVLGHLEVQLEKEYELRKKILSAFLYPGVIISITLILAIGIVIFVMPKITDIFSSFDVKLPLPTRVLMGFSSFVLDKPLLATFSAALTIMFIIMLFKVKFLKPFWHRVFLHLPVFGKIIIYASLARFSRTLNSLLQAGIPITEALDIIGHMIGNSFYKKAILEARDRVEQGGKLGESFGEYRTLFPPLVSKMLYIGEEAGSMETATDHLAKLYERNVHNLTKNLSVLLEPILLVFMGLLIGGIALSIILPIYQLPNLISEAR